MDRPSGESDSLRRAGGGRRALLVCRSLPCHVRGGLELHAFDLASGLAEAGWEVHTLSAPLPAEARAELEARRIAPHELAGVRADRYSLAYLRGVGERIEALHARNAYDVIHGQEFAFGFWDPAPQFSAAVALSVHGTITSETPLHPDLFSRLSPPKKLAALARFGRRYLFAPAWRRMLGRAEAILVDSQFTERELARMHPEILPRISLAPLGVDMRRYPPAESGEARAALGWPEGDGRALELVTVGRLTWQKGHDIALEALAELRDFKWRYWIVGEGPSREAIARRAAELGLQDRAMLAGRVDDRTKALMLAGADLFLWPERTHTAFGLAGLEAMLMNTPVAASARGAIPELVDDQSGWLFDPDAGRAPGILGAFGRALAMEGVLSSGEAAAWESAGARAPLGGRSLAEPAQVLRELLSHPRMLAYRREGLRERTLVRFNPAAMISRTIAAYERAIEARSAKKGVPAR